MSKRKLIVSLLLAVASIVAGIFLLSPNTAVLDGNELDICEAVILDRLSSINDPKIVNVYLKVNGALPPAKLLQRLAKQSPPIVAAVSLPRGGPHLLLTIGRIHRPQMTTAAVSLSFMVVGDPELVAPDVGAGTTYFLDRKGSVWLIERVRNDWVS